jgi:hypothetical protein
LAAYYDTIAHDLLLKTVFPRDGFGEHGKALLRWLNKWSSEIATAAHGHGIPQGPIASDFLGECFLLPVDRAMMRRHAYLRYVDDVRLFGRSEREVRVAALELEVLCRNRGLIPQAKKFEIREAKSVDEVLKVLPSLNFAGEIAEGERPSIPARRAAVEFRRSLSGRPRRIRDKTRARYVLYRAAASKRLLRYVLLLAPHHPEHIDVFVYYLSHFPRDVRAIAMCSRLVQESPYEYVSGEAWQVLARMMIAAEMRGLIKDAVRAARGTGGFSLKWGACTFLCAAEHKGLGEYSKWTKFQRSALLQALLAPILPRARFRRDDVVALMLRRSAAEPGLALASPLVRNRCSLRELGVRVNGLPGAVQRTLRAIGLVQGPAARTEPVAELLARSLGVPAWGGWRTLLGTEYAHTCQLLAQAGPVFDSARSLWLIQQNSFNHAVFLAFQRWLAANGRPGTVNLVNAKGESLSFGVLVQKGNGFSTNYALVADVFRAMNSRRNTVPEAHPYATKGGRRTVPLARREQQQLVPQLRAAFEDIARVVG